MKKLILLLLLFISAPYVHAQSQTFSVSKDGFQGDWFVASTQPNGAALIVLSGSGGGNDFGNRWAPELNKKGYNVLSVSYFKDEGLPDQLERIPLEYVDKALAWIQDNPKNKVQKIGLIGVSKGAELALIQASRHPGFDAVVAVSPSSVVWQSINRQDYYAVKSSWTLHDEPLPFLPYDFSQGYTDIFNFYNDALANLSDHQDALIKVEKIQAPILLVSGGDDHLWPSQRMSDMIVKRLKKHSFSYPVVHKNIPDAGHMLLMTGVEDEENLPDDSVFKFLGGSKKTFQKDVATVQKTVYQFLGEHLQ